MKSSILQETFGSQKRWVTYKLEKVKDKLTKVPYALNGKSASSTDPATWSTFDEVVAQTDKVGIIFTEKKDLLGIDIDHCLEDGKLVQEYKEVVAEIIMAACTYVEVSPSGNGLHLFLKLKDPLTLVANKKAPFEAYTEKRYFTVTGDVYGLEEEVREVTSAEALEILSIIGYPWGKKKASETPKTEVQGELSDEQVLARMFEAKNGPDVQALYGGNLSKHGNDASSADMALCSHLAFWTANNPAQMERLWLASELGSREKTQTRKDYRDRTIEAAIAATDEVFVPKEAVKRTLGKKTRVLLKDGDKEEVVEVDGELSVPEEDGMSASELDLLYTVSAKKDVVYTQNTENMCRILRKHPEFKNRIRYDIFKNVTEFYDLGKWRDIKDSDVITIQTEISIAFSFFGKVGKQMIEDAMNKVAQENTIDSAADYVRSIKWDGEKRLDSWLHNTYGVADDEYHRAVGSNWMKGLVKRIIEPGCKFDYVLVLEGEQGIKKSTSLSVLGRDWHVETTMSTDNKDFFMQFHGKAIIEFSEGETLSRTEVKRLKAVITTASDKYRPAYGRFSVDFPRRCVFAMTTNQEEYLKDETGNRRWLPVACKGTANVEWLEANRDQLFAEAYQRVIVDRETTWEFPEELMREAQNARRVHDPYEDTVVDWYFNKLSSSDREAGVTCMQCYRDAYNGGQSYNGRVDKYTEMAITNIFRNVLRLEKVRRMSAGIQFVKWVLSENSMQNLLDKMPLSEQEKADAAYDDF